MGKLVRDGIPNLIRADGRDPEVRRLDREAYELALLDKLLEEAEELRVADTASRLEEAADVYEVLVAIARSMNVSMAEVEQRAKQKRADRGGFDERWWLE